MRGLSAKLLSHKLAMACPVPKHAGIDVPFERDTGRSHIYCNQNVLSIITTLNILDFFI